jgi:hypothetical protein
MLPYCGETLRLIYQRNRTQQTEEVHTRQANVLLLRYNHVLYSLGFQGVSLPDAVLMAYYGQIRIDSAAYYLQIEAAEAPVIAAAAYEAARMYILPPHDPEAEEAARQQREAQHDADHWTRQH